MHGQEISYAPGHLRPTQPPIHLVLGGGGKYTSLVPLRMPHDKEIRHVRVMTNTFRECTRTHE
jgi:hypothetical protein